MPDSPPAPASSPGSARATSSLSTIFALKELDSDSIPVNFLMPFIPHPTRGTWESVPRRCLKILAMARFVCPDREIRIAGGREMHLRSLQGLALHVANSIFPR